MQIWMILDPSDEVLGIPRVAFQTRPFNPEFDMSAKARERGEVWEVRIAELDDQVWADLMGGKLSPDEQDRVHRELWGAGAEELWPSAP